LIIDDIQNGLWIKIRGKGHSCMCIGKTLIMAVIENLGFTKSIVFALSLQIDWQTQNSGLLSRAVLVIYSVCSDQSVNAELDQNN
jgi:hypothetical protein